MRMDGLEELKTQIRGIEIPICIVSACIFRVESFDEGQEAAAEFTCLHCWCRLAEIASSTIDYDRGTGGPLNELVGKGNRSGGGRRSMAVEERCRMTQAQTQQLLRS